MDILLIDPPHYILKNQVSARGYNLGLTSLAAFLRDKGIETAIITGDLLIEPPRLSFFSSIIPGWLKIDAKDLIAAQRNQESIVSDNNHKIWKALSAKIREIMPKAVGIPYYTPQKPIADLIVSLVKEVNPEIRTIAGSFHATTCPDDVMKNPDIDFVVRGEGEIPLFNLVMEIKQANPRWGNIPGIHYRDSNGEIKNNPPAEMVENLDRLPFPARDLVLDCDYNKYTYHSLVTARGCPYSCAFCADKKLWNAKVRRRSVDNVIEEIRSLKRTYGLKYFEIVDGTFTYDRNYLQAFCNAMIKNNLDLKWGCTARYNNLDKETLRLMKRARCHGLYIGLESGSDTVLKSMNKQQTLQQAIEVSKMIHGSGIFQVTSILLGSPDETKEDIELTLEAMKTFPTDFFDINIYMPLPGTPFYEVLSEEEKQDIDGHKTGFKNFGNYFSKHLSKDDLGKYQHQAYEIAHRRRTGNILRVVTRMVVDSTRHSFKRLIST